MRIIIAIVTAVLGAPAAVSIGVHSAGANFGSLISALPDPATAGIMFAGLGLVAGARRARSNSVAD